MGVRRHCRVILGYGHDDAPDHASKTSPLDMLAEPGAVRVLRAFTQLPEGPLRGSVLDLLEKMAGDKK
jgi:hypothetical protein